MTDIRLSAGSGIALLWRACGRLPLQGGALLARLRSLLVTPRAPRGLSREAQARRRLLRRLRIGAAVIAGVIAVSVLGLWWRLASGPLSIDVATPWLTAAIEERFGGRHHVEVGGTQLERTEEGRTALRLRDVVVRDLSGTVVASAPKAEVGISGISLLGGHVQADRLSLIGAAMAVRVERDGQVTVFAGATPESGAPVAAQMSLRGVVRSASEPRPSADSSDPAPPAADALATFLGWLDRLDALGLDGRDLTEIGLKSGSLEVDDQRNGKRWTFANINLSLTRPREGGVALAVNSTGADGPWSLTATVTPRGEGRRAIEAVLRDLSPKDLMLALRMGDGTLDADMPISAILRAEITADGVPLMAEGRVVVGAGYVGDADVPDERVLIDEAQLNLRWDAATRQLTVPLEILSGPNRIQLLGQIEAPRESGGAWGMTINRGKISLAAVDKGREPPLVLDRMAVRARIDPARRRFEVIQGDIAGAAAGLAFSGSVDYSGAEPRIAAGLAGTRMTAAALKRIWPSFLQGKVREWVIDHVISGTVEKLVIAANAPLPTLRANGPPVPDDGISIEIVSSGAVVRPIETLPAIRDADLVLSVKGRHPVVRVSHAIADLPSGRKLVLSNGVFEVPDTFPKAPPARMRMKIEGPVEAVAELVDMEPLRDAAGMRIDPATSRGTVAAQVSMGFPIRGGLDRSAVSYTVEADVTNLSVDKLVRGYKVEAQTLRLSCTPQGVQIKGDVRLAGTPATIEYRLPSGGNGDAEFKAQATLDREARARFGLDLHGAIGGVIPVKMSGRIGGEDRESRVAVEADLTQANIGEVVPGWNKPAGKPGRVTFVVVGKPQSTRLEDIVLDSAGALVKGTVDLDEDGDLVLANFPNFGMSDGDRASMRAERAPDGTLRVQLRGDVYDGRGLVKGAMGSGPDKGSQPARDVDLDVKVGVLAGYNGEALRGVDLRLSRRNAQIRSFALTARLGREATLLGDIRGYNNGRQVIYLEANDAGALFRFTDTYPRITGGQMWVALDPPTGDKTPQDGLLNVKDFSVRGEPALERIAAGVPLGDANLQATGSTARGSGVAFSRMRLEFTRSPGKLTIRDGVVMGPSVGATIEGTLDYARDDVRMRGTFVPAYALNNMFARVPILGLILGGGQNEGVFGVTYEVVGPPHAPTLHPNPISAVAPGFLRKFFEFRGAEERTTTPPTSYR
jgi:hypothetical protein